jgi:uncharacterized protein (DUF849 family)
MIVQGCLNGARKPGFHPRLPLTPAALAEDAAACVAAGAAEFHIHPRAADGRESLSAEAVGAAVAAIRARLPGTFVGISTGAWIEGDADRTLAAIGAWRVAPDYASVNFSEPAAPAVLELLRHQGVGIEAGIWTVADAERLVRLGLGGQVLRVLIEVDGAEGAAAEADAIRAVLDRAALRRPLLLHGSGENTWALVAAAARHRMSTRIGLEDTDRLPDGNVAADNAALVAAAVRIMRG